MGWGRWGAWNDTITTHGKLLIDVRTGVFNGSSTLELQDFSAAASLSSAGTVSPTLRSGGWYWGSLNSTGRLKINRTGLTQFRLRFWDSDWCCSWEQ